MFKLLKVTEAKKAISDLEEKLLAQEESLVSIQSELVAATDFNSDLQGVVAEKELEATQLQVEVEDAHKKIKELEDNALDAVATAADIVASVGAEKPVEAETAKDKSNEELNEEFNTITDPAAKVEFYRKHRSKLLNKE